MKALYDGRCFKCGKPIAKDDEIYYERTTKKIYHPQCYVIATTPTDETPEQLAERLGFKGERVMLKALIDLLVDAVECEPIPGAGPDDSGLPWATHRGSFSIGDAEFEVVVLNTGQQLITEESLMRFLEFLEDGKVSGA